MAFTFNQFFYRASSYIDSLGVDLTEAILEAQGLGLPVAPVQAAPNASTTLTLSEALASALLMDDPEGQEGEGRGAPQESLEELQKRRAQEEKDEQEKREQQKLALEQALASRNALLKEHGVLTPFDEEVNRLYVFHRLRKEDYPFKSAGTPNHVTDLKKWNESFLQKKNWMDGFIKDKWDVLIDQKSASWAALKDQSVDLIHQYVMGQGINPTTIVLEKNYKNEPQLTLKDLLESFDPHIWDVEVSTGRLPFECWSQAEKCMELVNKTRMPIKAFDDLFYLDIARVKAALLSAPKNVSGVSFSPSESPLFKHKPEALIEASYEPASKHYAPLSIYKEIAGDSESYKEVLNHRARKIKKAKGRLQGLGPSSTLSPLSQAVASLLYLPLSQMENVNQSGGLEIWLKDQLLIEKTGVVNPDTKFRGSQAHGFYLKSWHQLVTTLNDQFKDDRFRDQVGDGIEVALRAFEHYPLIRKRAIGAHEPVLLSYLHRTYLNLLSSYSDTQSIRARVNVFFKEVKEEATHKKEAEVWSQAVMCALKNDHVDLLKHVLKGIPISQKDYSEGLGITDCAKSLSLNYWPASHDKADFATLSMKALHLKAYHCFEELLKRGAYPWVKMECISQEQRDAALMDLGPNSQRTDIMDFLYKLDYEMLVNQKHGSLQESEALLVKCGSHRSDTWSPGAILMWDLVDPQGEYRAKQGSYQRDEIKLNQSSVNSKDLLITVMQALEGQLKNLDFPQEQIEKIIEKQLTLPIEMSNIDNHPFHSVWEKEYLEALSVLEAKRKLRVIEPEVLENQTHPLVSELNALNVLEAAGESVASVASKTSSPSMEMGQKECAPSAESMDSTEVADPVSAPEPSRRRFRL